MVIRRRDRVRRRRAVRLAATQVIEQTLARIARRDTVLNAFTTVTAERALARCRRKAGRTVGRRVRSR